MRDRATARQTHGVSMPGRCATVPGWRAPSPSRSGSARSRHRPATGTNRGRSLGLRAGGWMYARLAAAVRRFDEKFGWSWIGACLSVGIIAAAAFVLYHSLRGIDFRDVVEAIRETRLRDVAIAAGFVAAAYFTLTFYDLFALRTIGRRDVPY